MPRTQVLLITLVLTAPLVVPLCRVFFGSWPHFAYDAGLRPVPERMQWPAIRPHLSSVVATLLLDLLGFFVAYAAVIGASYYTLLWILAFFRPGA
jgi:hypothetical protein